MSRPGLFAAGGNHTLVVTEKTQLIGWGGNYYGQVGDGTCMDRHGPVLLRSTGAYKVGAGRCHSLLITEVPVLVPVLWCELLLLQDGTPSKAYRLQERYDGLQKYTIVVTEDEDGSIVKVEAKDEEGKIIKVEAKDEGGKIIMVEVKDEDGEILKKRELWVS